MNHIMTCTTEELALLVSLCGEPGIAKGIAEAAIGEKSPQEWEAIMEVTVHQLILKQLWDTEKDQRGENPLSEPMQEFIQSYIQSEWMLRCSNAFGQNTLMLHQVDDSTWLAHIVDRDIIHEFSYMDKTEIPKLIKEYYSFAPVEMNEVKAFQLTDEAFDLLSDPHQIEKVKSLSDFTAEEESYFNEFVQDIEAHNWTLNNISFFNVPNVEEAPLLHNIVFFLPSTTGIWSVEYTDDPIKPVFVQLIGSAQWEELLDGVGTVATSV
ncbi:hypothetical protein [Alkalihalobacterium elongatum]|uniref:hypothetical protein n=1 Tax=Alkalihalobacterium elongatum TaxID=2675466 RepID=UPI001C1FEE95|nr:hypothetical protein [Alkalihalobacterium elongatum]